MALGAPTTPLRGIDGPDENPLSDGGKWAPAWRYSRPGLQRVHSGATPHLTDIIHGSANYTFWTPEAFPDNVEVWGCISGGQLGAALETWRLSLWQGDPANGVGYMMFYGGGIGKYFALRNYSSTGTGDFVETPLAGGGYPTTMKLAIVGDRVEGWASYDYGLTWGLVGYMTDAGHRGGDWHIGLGIEDPTGGGLSFTCFGGGVPRRTQFFRWTRGFKEFGDEGV